MDRTSPTWTVSSSALTARLPRVIGAMMGLSGVSYLVQGWVLSSAGFVDTNTFAILASYLLILAWISCLVVIAWRAPAASQATVDVVASVRSSLPLALR